ncbi:MAG: Fur family ferric uptake transcriptional regulator [Phycisphaerales bacterium]|jgi:Fur family ferric uptake transcriptional regulator
MKLDPIPANPSGESPDTDPFDDLDIIEPLCAVFRRALKAEGLKYTPERARILDTIIRLDGMFEADQLLEQMRASGFRVSKATVYRTIKLLEDAGIIQRVLFDREQSHYQLAYGKAANTLLVRMDTGEVEAIEVPELIALRDKLCAARGLKAEGHRLQIFATKG